jgi:hypothetical protein
MKQMTTTNKNRTQPHRSAARTARIIEKGSRILELRKSGASFRAISRQLIKQAEAAGESTAGLSYNQIRNDYSQLIELSIEESKVSIEEQRVLATERLDDILLHFMPYVRLTVDASTSSKMVRMKMKAGDIVIKAIKEHAEICGLKRPQKLEITGTDGGPLITSVIIEPVKSNIPDPRTSEELNNHGE